MITNARVFKEKHHDSLEWQTFQECLNNFSFQKHPYVSDCRVKYSVDCRALVISFKYFIFNSEIVDDDYIVYI